MELATKEQGGNYGVNCFFGRGSKFQGTAIISHAIYTGSLHLI